MNLDGRHRTFCSRDDRELRLWRDIAGCVNSAHARLLRVIYPHETTFLIKAAAECFVKVSREFGAEVEKKRVARERVGIRENNVMQLA